LEKGEEVTALPLNNPNFFIAGYLTEDEGCNHSHAISKLF
jgi:hypothetical protein